MWIATQTEMDGRGAEYGRRGVGEGGDVDGVPYRYRHGVRRLGRSDQVVVATLDRAGNTRSR